MYYSISLGMHVLFNKFRYTCTVLFSKFRYTCICMWFKSVLSCTCILYACQHLQLYVVGLSGVGCITCQHCLLPQLSDLLYTETVIRHADLETAPLLVLANKQDRMVWLVGIQVHACTWVTCFITQCPNILTQEVVVKYITHVLVKDFSLSRQLHVTILLLNWLKMCKQLLYMILGRCYYPSIT